MKSYYNLTFNFKSSINVQYVLKVLLKGDLNQACSFNQAKYFSKDTASTAIGMNP